MGKQKRVYLTEQTHAALMAHCKGNGLIAQAFVDTAIREAIAARSIARRWNADSQQFVNYVVEYPKESNEVEGR